MIIKWARQRAKLTSGLVLLLTLAYAGVGQAHDFWLVPDAFRIAEGGQLVVRGQTSSKFPSSESAVTPDRVSEARVLGADEDVKVESVTVAGTSLMLRDRPQRPGQRIVALSVAPRSLRASGPEFKRYMELEGAARLAELYERQGILPKTDSITRRYAKYAKTIVEVGSGGSRAFSRTVGHPAEFIPLDDPSTARAGDTLRVKLLFQGKPLSQASVHAGRAVKGGEPIDLHLETDTAGITRVPLTHAGLWNVRTIHILPAGKGSGVDWDSHFVSLVFEVRASAK